MAEAARAWAFLSGKSNVGFDDVQRVAHPCLVHRLVLDYRAKLDGVHARTVVQAVLAGVSALERELPGAVQG